MTIIQMSDTCFAAYLAALIDGEGSIEIHPKECGIRLRIGLTTPTVLFDIHNRLKLGSVREDRSRVKKGFRPLWSLAISNAYDCRTVFTIVRPYMQIKADRMDYALEVIQRMQDRVDEIDRRNRLVLGAIKAGEKQKDIGARFGLSQAAISRIKLGHTWKCEIDRHLKLNARRGIKKSIRPSDQLFRLHGEPLVSPCREPIESSQTST